MAIWVLGINYKSASLTLRERLAFGPDSLKEALQSLSARPAVRELAILSTCNRTEIYLLAEETGLQFALDWLCQYRHVEAEELEGRVYQLEGVSALRHMMRVACGLDSMVLGEPQILGQFKAAIHLAREHHFIGAEGSALFHRVFAAAKQVRSETAVGKHPVSLAFVAVNIARRIFANLKANVVLLIGAGEMMELVARHFKGIGVKQIIVANRTMERASDLAAEVDGKAIALAELGHRLVEADIVISSTAAPLPILGKGLVETVVKQRRHRPMLMVDLAVPRDIEPEVAELNDVYLYSLDDLQGMISDNLESRLEAAQAAERIIERQARVYWESRKARNSVGTVKAYRNKVEAMRAAELKKSLAALEKGKDPEQVLERFSRNFANKMMHGPCVGLKEAGVEERYDLLSWFRGISGLADANVRPIQPGVSAQKKHQSEQS